MKIHHHMWQSRGSSGLGKVSSLKTLLEYFLMRSILVAMNLSASPLFRSSRLSTFSSLQVSKVTAKCQCCNNLETN